MGNLFQCLITLTIKKNLLLLKLLLHWNRISYIPACTHCLLPWHWVWLKKAWLHLFCLPHQIFIYILVRSLWAFTYPGWAVSSSFNFPSHGRCSIPLLTFMALCWTCFIRSMSVLYWGAQHCHQGLVEKDHLPWSASNKRPNPAQDTFGLFCQ